MLSCNLKMGVQKALNKNNNKNSELIGTTIVKIYMQYKGKQVD